MYELPNALAPMQAYKQFILYRLVPSISRPGKTDKLPIDPTTFLVGSAHDQKMWMDVETAAALAEAMGPDYGVGFVFTEGDPFWFMDIDNCRTGESWNDTANNLLQWFPGAAAEVSVSGNGLHIFGCGKPPPHKTRFHHFFEFYSANRFAALGTNAVGNIALDFSAILPVFVAKYLARDAGNPEDWRDGPVPEWKGPVDDDELIRRITKSKSKNSAFGLKITPGELFNGDLDALIKFFPDSGSDRGYNASDADSALAQHLAFWTGNDHERIKRIMERSALKRDKWERPDYLSRTITNVVNRQCGVLGDQVQQNGISNLLQPTDQEIAALILKTADNPAAPYSSENIEKLARLKAARPGEYENLRAALKNEGCRVTALDPLIADRCAQIVGSNTPADFLVGLAASAELFHSPGPVAYANVQQGDHRENWQIRSAGFRRWLVHQSDLNHSGPVGNEAIDAAIRVLEARAILDGPEEQVFTRVAERDGRIYLDIGDKSWKVVEVRAEGWTVLEKSPIRFRRTIGMLPLPIPVAGGSVEELKSSLNIQSQADFVLVVAWLLGALRARGPYPLLVVSGEQGSAKSTFSSLLIDLIDPNVAALRPLQKDHREIFISASNRHVLAFDNISSISASISDSLCRISTGGGYSVRKLYSDSEEMLFDVSRPIIINGIADVVTRPDLADRSVFLHLSPIPDDRRRGKDEVLRDFRAAHAKVLGALLTAVSTGLRNINNLSLLDAPRMADFAIWVTACERALWVPGTFANIYRQNRDEAIDMVIDGDAVMTEIRRMLMLTQTQLTGTASELLQAINRSAGYENSRSVSWPKDGRALSHRLRRAEVALRKVGITVEYTRSGHGGDRVIRISFSRQEETND